jgi:signal transduction histidine kinase
MERLWSAFEQLETGSSRRYGGTGLGLSLTRRIVEAQGGSVGAESTPGAGTCFWVVLPRVARLVDDERALTMAG